MTTERQILDMLHRRLGGQTNGTTERFVLAEHVRYDPSAGASGHRIADAIAIDCWHSSRFALHGYEVKITRSDWLRELRDPDKAEVWAQHCHYWWLIAPPGVVRDDLPAGWGHLTVRGAHLAQKVGAPRRNDVVPLPPGPLAGFVRAVAQTTNQRARGMELPTKPALELEVPRDLPTLGIADAPTVWTADVCPIFDCLIPYVHAHDGRIP